MGSLVTTSWLAGRLEDPDVVVLDATLPPVGVTPPVDTRARYYTAHIPGAVFFDIEELSDHPNPLPHMLPPAEVFARNVSALGIGDQMDIVIYEQEGVFSGPRAWWTLRTFGAQSVYLLDGGLRAWIDAGLPTHSGPVHRAPEVFRAKLDEDLRRIFVKKGVDLEQPITTTCGSGVTAAVLALGLEAAGAKQVTLYDGSWAEYAAHPQA